MSEVRWLWCWNSLSASLESLSARGSFASGGGSETPCVTFLKSLIKSWWSISTPRVCPHWTADGGWPGQSFSALCSILVIIQRVSCLYYSLHHKIGQLAVKQQIQCMAWLDSLFSTSRQITSYATKDSGSIHRSKTSRYLLLNLCHPDIIFAQIVWKRDEFIIHKPERVLLIIS